MNILIIMPNFFSYPNNIKKTLEQKGHNVDIFDDRPSTNSFIKSIIRVKKNLINFYINKYFNSILKVTESRKYDVILVISGQSFSFTKEMFTKLKLQQNNAKFVLYQWDSIKNFSYITEFYEFFDDIYTFDRDDSIEKKINFLPLFYIDDYKNIGMRTSGGNDYQYDFSFVGTAHPKKYKFVKEMSKELKSVYNKQFIYFFFPSRMVFLYRKFKNIEFKNSNIQEFKFEALNSKEMMDIFESSKVILDSAQAGQKGLTIRVIETLGAKRKLITTNEDIVNYDFYDERNIYVYNGQFNFSSEFFNHDFIELDNSIYEKYSIDNWLENLIK